MSFAPRRLRGAELIVAAAVVIMVVALFALPWSGPAGGSGAARDGWNATTTVRFMVLVAVLTGAGLVVAQMVFRAPAIPASLSVISTVIALIACVWLLIRVLVTHPAHEGAGAWVELAGAIALLVGSFMSMREEGIAERDGPGEVPVVDLAAQPGSSGPPA